MAGEAARQGDAIGPYLLVAPVGHGGMGAVWRARHRETGREVAVKTVRAVRHGDLEGIRREIHALAELCHPGVVAIVDHGVEGGVPWYAMELLEGESLRHCLRGARAWASDATTTPVDRVVPGPDFPATPAAAVDGAPSAAAVAGSLAILRRLCEPLSFLHGEGIVHRDLKPENVLIRPDAAPVIVDFGLASRFAREGQGEVLEASGGIVGTVAYMAPEQGRGELPDARADLYALGCILYEALTGRPPFVADDALAIYWQHLTAAPEPPSRLAPGVPPELDLLVLRLLAKDPRARVGYAEDVARVLDRIGVPAPPPSSAPPGRAYLYRPALAGRRELLAQLQARLEGAQSGRGSLVLLSGESGVGKTRLASELSRVAAERRVPVVTGACNPGVRRPLEPLLPFLTLLADRCREMGATETARLVGDDAPLLLPYAPALVGIRGADVSGMAPEAARPRIAQAIASALRAWAEVDGGLLLLDDLQWADELTSEALAAVRRAIDASRLCVVATCRAEEMPEPVASLFEPPSGRRLDVGRLTRDEVGEMVGAMLALRDPPAPLVSFVADGSEGNPFFVAEYLRLAVARDLLKRDGEGTWTLRPVMEGPAEVALPLPSSVQGLLARRLLGLDPESRALLDAAAVLGRDVEPALLEPCAGIADPLGAAHRLVARQLLEPAGPGYRFCHDKVREVAYDLLEPARRAALHRAAAVALEAVGASDPGPRQAEIGHHWDEAGEAERAATCYLAAARDATGRFAFAEAERLYRAHLALRGSERPEAIVVRNEMGFAILTALGRTREARREHRRALADARRLGIRTLQAQSLTALGVVCNREGRPSRALVLYSRALEVYRAAGLKASEASVLGNMANVLQGAGRLAEARQRASEALALHRASGDVVSLAGVLTTLALVCLDEGDAAAAASAAEEAAALHREAGLRDREAMSLGNLALASAAQGRLAEAAELLERVRVVAREVGNALLEGQALAGLADLHGRAGRFTEADAGFREAVRLARSGADRRDEGLALSAWAGILRAYGRTSAAREMAESARSILRSVRARHAEATLGALLAALDVDDGRPAEAIAGHRTALALLEEMGCRADAARARVDLARALRVAGDPEAAATERARGIEDLRACGDVHGLAWALVERAHASRGDERDAALREADALRAALGLPVESPLARAVDGASSAPPGVAAGS